MTRVGASTWRPYLLHLRLGFNLLLSPVYLWGALLAGGSALSADFWLGYVALHVFLYGGTTAFNSYYDRDEGPIGGMLKPVRFDRGLLPFSLVVQALGLIPAALVGWRFLLGWLALFLVGVAYSHPAVRLKADPAGALAAVGMGQGMIGFALGWLTVRPDGLLSAQALVGCLSAALIITGLYLVTQCYQEAEDRARGDRTIAVLVGARRSLLMALAPLTAGAAVLLAWARLNLGATWALALGLFFAALAVLLVAWASRFDERSVTENFRTAMRFTVTASLGLAAFLLSRLLLG